MIRNFEDGIERVCATCRYMDREFKECRVHAPITMLGPQEEDSIAIWPKVERVDWCGEWAFGEIQFSEATLRRPKNA